MKNIISLNLVIGLCLGIVWMPQVQAIDFSSQASQLTTPSIVFAENDGDDDDEDFCGG